MSPGTSLVTIVMLVSGAVDVKISGVETQTATRERELT